MSFSRTIWLAVTLLIAAWRSGPAFGQPPLPDGARFRLGTLDFRHTDDAHARIRMSPDGKALFSCDGNGVILWDIATAKKVRTYDQGWLFAISPDGRYLALVGKIHEVHLVNVKSGKTQVTIDAKEWIRSAAFSSDSKTLFTGGDQCEIRAWRVSDGTALRRFQSVSSSIDWIAPAADGKTCLGRAGGYLEGRIHRFDAATGKQLTSLANVHAAAATPDSKTVVAARGRHEVVVWDAPTGKERQQFTAGEGTIHLVALSPDGNTLALASYDDTFRTIDLSSDKQPHVLLDARGPVRAMTFSADGKTLAAAGWTGVIRFWRDGKELPFPGHRSTVVSLAFTPNSKTLISRGMDYTVRLWDVATGKETKQFASPEGGNGHGQQSFLKIFHLLDNDTLLRSVPNGASILDLKSGQDRPLAYLPKGTPATVSLDGRLMVIYQKEGAWSKRTTSVTFTLWDRVAGRKIRDFTPSFKDAPILSDLGPSPTAAMIAPDGKTIATSWIYHKSGAMGYRMDDVGHGVSLWDVETGKERPVKASSAVHLALLDDGELFVSTAGVFALSPDRKLYADGSGFAIRLRRTDTGDLVKQYDPGHRSTVTALAFSPDGRWLASGSSDTTVVIWELPAPR